MKTFQAAEWLEKPEGQSGGSRDNGLALSSQAPGWSPLESRVLQRCGHVPPQSGSACHHPLYSLSVHIPHLTTISFHSWLPLRLRFLPQLISSFLVAPHSPAPSFLYYLALQKLPHQDKREGVPLPLPPTFVLTSSHSVSCRVRLEIVGVNQEPVASRVTGGAAEALCAQNFGRNVTLFITDYPITLVSCLV